MLQIFLNSRALQPAGFQLLQLFEHIFRRRVGWMRFQYLDGRFINHLFAVFGIRASGHAAVFTYLL